MQRDEAENKQLDLQGSLQALVRNAFSSEVPLEVHERFQAGEQQNPI